MQKKYKIYQSDLIYFLSLIFLCEPPALAMNRVVNYVFYAAKALIYVYIFYISVFKRMYRTFKLNTKLLMLLQLCLLFSTLINKLTPIYWALYALNFVAIVILTEKAMRENPKSCLFIICVVFFAFLFINLCLNLIGFKLSVEGSGYHFLGIRTRITDSVIPLLCAYVLYRQYFLPKWTYKCIMSDICVFSLVIVSAFKFKVATAVFGIALFFVLYFVLSLRVMNKLINNRLFLLFIAIIVVGVIVFRIQEKLGFIFSMVFDKDTTMSYRTEIWDSAFVVFRESIKSIIFGHGISIRGEWVPFGARMFQAHDQYLQMLLDGGIVGFLSFIAYIFSAMHVGFSYRNTKAGIISFCSIITIIIISITEIYFYYPHFYLVIAMLSGIEYLIKDNDTKLFAKTHVVL